MIWIPHRLCQTVAWTFSMGDLNAPEVTLPRAFQERLKLHHFLMHCVVLFHVWSNPRRFSDHVLSLVIACVLTFQLQKLFSPDFTQVISQLFRYCPSDFPQQLVRVLRYPSQPHTLGHREGLVHQYSLAGCFHHRHVQWVNDPIRDFAFNGRP